ncbi:neuronal acetylcholine receptor subunit alpha-10-like [Babylonia areolata]|uniref:neuronal acetylcholine receptor subunit alpha-10-like n=1 Tax=Babylonia areolata TaxID=304850 RepID=UPI003FCFEA5E
MWEVVSMWKRCGQKVSGFGAFTVLCGVLLTCLCGQGVQGHAGGRGGVYDEERLHRHLLDNYVREARPVTSTPHPVNVSISFSFVRIEDLIETTDTFAATVFIVQTWRDPRLRWNQSDFGGLGLVRLAREKLWTPDIVLYNVAVQGTPKTRYEDVVTVSSDGAVIWVPMVTLYATCPMDLTQYPYDVQTCTLVFGSWTHTTKEMHVKFLMSNQTEVEVDTTDEDTSSYSIDQHPHWEMVGKAKARISMKSYSCCVDQFTLLSVTCRLARKPHFYRYLTVGPAAVLGLLVPVLFLLPPGTSGNKTCFGLLLLLCLTMLMLILENAVPYTHGSLPHVASFYLGTVILTTFSVLLSVGGTILSKKGQQHKPLPPWIRSLHSIFLGRLGLRRLLCMGDYMPVDNTPSATLRSDDAVTLHTSGDPAPPSDGTDVMPVTSGSTEHQVALLQEMVRCVRFMAGRMAAEEGQGRVRQQWEELAQVMDRCLFLIFFALYLFTAVSLLT